MLSRLLEWSGFEESRRGVIASCGRCCGLPLRGRAVVKETANVRDVLEICRHHEALCRVSVAMDAIKQACGWTSLKARKSCKSRLAPSLNGEAKVATLHK